MAVVGFRNHSFCYLISIPHTYNYVNKDGDFVPNRTTFSEEINCNAVPNSGEATVRNAEGKKVEYSFTLYCEPNIADLSFGDVIRLNREGIIYELSVKGFHRYTNMVKIWV